MNTLNTNSTLEVTPHKLIYVELHINQFMRSWIKCRVA